MECDDHCRHEGYRLDLLRSEGKFDTYSSIGTEFCIRAARSGCVIDQIRVQTLPRIGNRALVVVSLRPKL